jgi:hypothetical protein
MAGKAVPPLLMIACPLLASCFDVSLGTRETPAYQWHMGDHLDMSGDECQWW